MQHQLDLLYMSADDYMIVMEEVELAILVVFHVLILNLITGNECACNGI